MQRLIAQINHTNSSVTFETGTLTDALAARDVLRLRQAMLRDLAEAATVTQFVGTRSEVRFRPAVNISEVQKQADNLAQDLRRLDARIQEANWLTNLIE